MPRFHSPSPLVPGARMALGAAAARHVQVLRMQPGQPLTLFDGRGGEYDATVVRMGRSEVDVEVGAHRAIEREAPRAVHIAIGMPANERMDWLVEKATELGVASVQPLLAERSVIKLTGERALKKQAHWQAIAVAACEQCGRNQVPVVHPVTTTAAWLAALGPAPVDMARLLLSLDENATTSLASLDGARGGAMLLSGPEGGLTPAEVGAARTAGFLPLTLGARVLRAETAPLAALVALTLPR